jgi:hypothetical protein
MTFFSFPLEVLKYIFDYLRLPERANCRLVCSYWRNALDRKSMWNDLEICIKISLSKKHSLQWLSNNTRIFDDIDKIKILALNYREENAIDIEWLLSNYSFDKCFIEILWIHLINNRTLKSLKIIDSFIRKSYPDIIEKNIKSVCDSFAGISVGKEFYGVYADKKTEWIIKRYMMVNLQNLPKSFVEYEVFCYIPDLVERYCYKSAKLLMKIAKILKVEIQMYFDMSRYINNNEITCKFISIYKLYKSKFDDNLSAVVFRDDLKSLLWFWVKTRILPGKSKIWNKEKNILRSAKIAHTMISYTTGFDQLKWIVDNFNPVLKKISCKHKKVKKYIKDNALRSYKLKTRIYDSSLTKAETISRISYYIMAGNTRKLKFVLRNRINYVDMIEHGLEWLDIASKYPVNVYKAVRKVLTKAQTYH